MKKYLFILFLFTGCSENLFDEIADKDTNEAIFFDAQQQLNSRNYSAAISLLSSLDPAFLANRNRIPIHASAYAGRCGLDFLVLLDTLSNTPPGATVLSTLMAGFPAATKTGGGGHEDCTLATDLLLGIGDETVRNGDENLLMAFSSLAKIGAILSAFADTDDDGVADAAFDICVDDDDNLPEARVRDVGASFATAILSLGAVGTSYVDDSVASIQAICDFDPSLAGLCTKTDPSTFTGPEVQALRYAIGSSDFGVDRCDGTGNDFTACAAANPVCP
jgi:hypothetical protein